MSETMVDEVEVVTNEVEAAALIDVPENSETVGTDIPSTPEEEPSVETAETDDSESSEEEKVEATEKEEQEKKEEPKPKAKPAQERINKLTRRYYDEKRRADKLEAEHEELKRKLAEKEPEAEPKKNEPPNEDDFEDFSDYVKALARFEAEQVIDASKPTEQVPTEEPVTDDGLAERLKEGTDRYDDYDAVAYNKDLPVSKEMAAVIAEADYPADVLYRLGKDIDRTAEIATMTPHQMAMALGKLDYEPEEKKVVKKETSAPAPIKPVKGGGSAVGKDPEKMSHEEYRKWREGT